MHDVAQENKIAKPWLYMINTTTLGVHLYYKLDLVFVCSDTEPDLILAIFFTLNAVNDHVHGTIL